VNVGGERPDMHFVDLAASQLMLLSELGFRLDLVKHNSVQYASREVIISVFFDTQDLSVEYAIWPSAEPDWKLERYELLIISGARPAFEPRIDSAVGLLTEVNAVAKEIHELDLGLLSGYLPTWSIAQQRVRHLRDIFTAGRESIYPGYNARQHPGALPPRLTAIERGALIERRALSAFSKYLASSEPFPKYPPVATDEH
jgi:hypothetical protein